MSKNDEAEISRKILKALQKHQKPKFFDKNRLIFAAISSFFLMTVYAAYVWLVQPKVTITDLDVYHNVRRPLNKNMKIAIDFETANLKNRSCKAVAYFYYKNGKKVRSTTSGYRTRDRQLSTSDAFRPSYKYTKYNNFNLYIPYKYFNTGNYKASVRIHCASKFIGKAKTLYFRVRKKNLQDVIITDLDVYYNVRKIKMVLDFETSHLKNSRCKALAYFYYKNGRKVRSTISGYRTTDNQLLTSKSFRPRYKYSEYNNFRLYIPNRYFNRGSYKAEVKTYCGKQFLGNTKTFRFTVGR